MIDDNFPKYVVTMDKLQWDPYKGIQHIKLQDFLSNNI